MKYGGGRPAKNRWTDNLKEYAIGDAMRAEWAYVPAGVFPEQQASTRYYLLIGKTILFDGDQGVEWRVINLETGDIYPKMMLNDAYEKGRATFHKLTGEQLKEKLLAMPKTEATREWWDK